ncbi:MAG: CoA pyrophosphatase [Candidatus Accumulibacter sp.]|jgi:8-oxo-dGTP pyrophosphatase MutT (NUDIX family)|nr:CoA pyrophosphatase [Accumulibacter sp.]
MPFREADASGRTPPGGVEVDLERLRSALLRRPADARPVVEAGTEAKEPIAAAVLFPIVLRENAPTVLLTQRTEHLRDHPGQISFPGGRVEADDASPVATALREAREEVGLDPRRVEIAGFLPEYRTATGYRIIPVVGFLTPPLALRSDPSEVAEIFEAPLSFLLDPANRRRHTREYQGRTRRFFAVPYGRHFIWGATAGIIVSLARAMEKP